LAENFLRPIIGEYLSGVCFVMDYVQLQFNGSGLSAYNPLSVHSGETTWVRPDSGWADALRGRIGQLVQGAHASDTELIIEFADRTEFRMSLRDEDYEGPEAFEFSSPGGPNVVG